MRNTLKKTPRTREERGEIFDNAFVTVYSYNMSQHKKILIKAQRNPEGLSFAEFQTLLTRYGGIKDHQRGSHQIWYSLEGQRLSIQNRNGMAKGYQVRQFLEYVKGEDQ